MEFQLLRILVFLSLGMVASQAPRSTDAYWNKVLPKDPMAKAVSDASEDRSTWGKHQRLLFKIDVSFSLSDSDTQPLNNSGATSFFLEGDLKKGQNMTLYFRDTHPEITFLPEKEAAKIPFSLDKFQEILSHFSVQPDSNKAKAIKNTIEDCEGEEKYCVTSEESMTNFSISKLGKSIQPICTVVKGESHRELQEYTIVEVNQMEGHEYVVCHNEVYSYAVFDCHKTSTIETYVVSLEGVNKTRAMAVVTVAVCYMDTSAWNPKHLAFQVLNVKLGSVSICHFLFQNDIIWVPKPFGFEYRSCDKKLCSC